MGVDIGVHCILYRGVCGMNRFSEFTFIVWYVLVTRSLTTTSRYKTKLFPAMFEEGLTIEKIC